MNRETMEAEDRLAHQLVMEDMGFGDFMECTWGDLLEIRRRAEELTGFKHCRGLIEEQGGIQ